MKIAVQCDFDGTITDEDVSFLLLDTFAEGKWRTIWDEYAAGKIPVGTFNRKAFSLIKADRKTVTDFVLKCGKIRVRPGFSELLQYCSGKGYKFIIVSNGLDFYIDAILKDLGLKGIKVYAAHSRFGKGGMKVKYVGPNGDELESGFKEAHTAVLKKKGYSVVYIGNGTSDSFPARQSSYVFATGDLLKLCKKTKLKCTPFDNLHEVVEGLKALKPG